MDDLSDRTQKFAIDVIDLADTLPNTIASRIIINQPIKAATSVGANYRAAKRARSDKEFISKINIVLEESDESGYWLEIVKVKEWGDIVKGNLLLKVSNEITAIFVSILKKMQVKMALAKNQK